MKLQKIKTNKLSKAARTRITCTFCGNLFTVDENFMWRTDDSRPVCYLCAKKKEWTRYEISLLLYLETCLVDQYGRVEGRKMNEDDIVIIKQWVTEGFVQFGRLSMKAIQKLRGTGKIYTHWIRFSNAAWRTAHYFRRRRSEVILRKENVELLREQA